VQRGLSLTSPARTGLTCFRIWLIPSRWAVNRRTQTASAGLRSLDRHTAT